MVHVHSADNKQYTSSWEQTQLHQLAVQASGSRTWETGRHYNLELGHNSRNNQSQTLHNFMSHQAQAVSYDR